MDKKKKAAIQKQEDQALTRALVWFAGAMVVEFLLLLVNNVFTRGIPSWVFANGLSNALPYIAAVLVIGAVAAGVWCSKRTKAKNELAFLPMVLAVALLVLALRTRKNNNVFQLKSVRFVFNPKHGGLVPVMVSCLLGIAALAAGLVLGSVVAFYLLFALLAWLLVLLVYYTVKLM